MSCNLDTVINTIACTRHIFTVPELGNGKVKEYRQPARLFRTEKERPTRADGWIAIMNDCCLWLRIMNGSVPDERNGGNGRRSHVALVVLLLSCFFFALLVHRLWQTDDAQNSCDNARTGTDNCTSRRL